MTLRRDHGQHAPLCVHNRTIARLKSIEWCEAGNYRGVLELAGVIKRAPIFRYWIDPVYGEPDQFGEVKFIGWVRVEISSFEPVCPSWAYDLAKRLTKDKALARRLGYVQRRQLMYLKAPGMVEKRKPFGRSAIVPDQKVWQDVDIDKVMPVEVRARIIRAAANNGLVREMISDDPEAAALILREVY